MKRLLITVNVPLSSGGETSARYIGIVMDANPIPTPTMPRPQSSITQLVANPMRKAPMALKRANDISQQSRLMCMLCILAYEYSCVYLSLTIHIHNYIM